MRRSKVFCFFILKFYIVLLFRPLDIIHMDHTEERKSHLDCSQLTGMQPVREFAVWHVFGLNNQELGNHPKSQVYLRLVPELWATCKYLWQHILGGIMNGIFPYCYLDSRKTVRGKTAFKTRINQLYRLFVGQFTEITDGKKVSYLQQCSLVIRMYSIYPYLVYLV